jgi:hypothetical protein
VRDRNTLTFLGERFHAVVPCFYLGLGVMVGAGVSEGGPEVRNAVRLGGAVFFLAALVIWLVRWWQRRAEPNAAADGGGR